jgi:quercetin dioxygenase-like cupin family protein
LRFHFTCSRRTNNRVRDFQRQYPYCIGRTDSNRPREKRIKNENNTPNYCFRGEPRIQLPGQSQTVDIIFPRGELSTVKNHTGNIWLKELNVGDSTFDPSIAVATYDTGAKLDWHIHPGGQVLLITEGTGYYQERGKPLQIVHKGDVIKCAPGVEHWHGASPKSGFAYIAVTPTQKGKTIWLEPVSDKDYTSVK